MKRPSHLKLLGLLCDLHLVTRYEKSVARHTEALAYFTTIGVLDADYRLTATGHIINQMLQRDLKAGQTINRLPSESLAEGHDRNWLAVHRAEHSIYYEVVLKSHLGEMLTELEG